MYVVRAAADAVEDFTRIHLLLEQHYDCCTDSRCDAPDLTQPGLAATHRVHPDSISLVISETSERLLRNNYRPSHASSRKLADFVALTEGRRQGKMF